MIPFRKETPKRRSINTVVTKYSDHRRELKTDFKCRCGYCNDIELWRTVWFEIDHFVPQKYLKTIKDTDYSNLVYACRSCNNSKRAHWPTQDELVHHKNDKGFIDPCNDEYDKQFAREENGKIIPQTKLGEWMYYKLKLHKPQHEIIWQIEELDNLIEECENILVTIDDNILKDKLLRLYQEYRKYTKQLGSI
ncbi:HNH endonuclease signature motif containing protein [Bergeyella zoohelcum]|uniref:HNH endonuclease n=1 Tax=Bergeyella zoohelcum TaxID=1015 RepID=UPI002A90CDFF|nr:HNH endonuclease signature motif containing protein [Bergeyella zoohelcum]MDY6026198.1 HNH endonuclease signature motif containing protein [Bergeyella zoohelcum]